MRAYGLQNTYSAHHHGRNWRGANKPTPRMTCSTSIKWWILKQYNKLCLKKCYIIGKAYCTVHTNLYTSIKRIVISHSYYTVYVYTTGYPGGYPVVSTHKVTPSGYQPWDPRINIPRILFRKCPPISTPPGTFIRVI